MSVDGIDAASHQLVTSASLPALGGAKRTGLLPARLPPKSNLGFGRQVERDQILRDVLRQR